MASTFEITAVDFVFERVRVMCKSDKETVALVFRKQEDGNVVDVYSSGSCPAHVRADARIRAWRKFGEVSHAQSLERALKQVEVALLNVSLDEQKKSSKKNLEVKTSFSTPALSPWQLRKDCGID